MPYFVHCIKKVYMAFFAIAEVWLLNPERISAVLALFSLFFTWLEDLFSRENGNVDF